MAIVGAVMVPHPPLILPEVGKGEEKIIQKTIDAYKKAADFVASLKPETIVLSSPHSIMYSNYLHISPGSHAEGTMARFHAPQVRIARDYDEELSQLLCKLARKERIPAGYEGERDPELDHGTIIPLYFIMQKYTDFRLVRLGISGISLAQQYRFGMQVQKAADRLNRRVVYVASGDLSHKLKESGPYGFDPHGPEYDARLMDVCGRTAFEELLEFDPVLLNKAAECGHRSFVIMAGALDQKSVKADVLSHEDVTGVGYGVCTFRVTGDDPSRNFLDQYEKKEEKRLSERKANEDPYTALARKTVELYIKTGKKPPLPKRGEVPDEMLDRKAGVFCSLHIGGRLRGCIGTISPVQTCIADEIIHNAVSAAMRDPRFDSVREDELPQIEYSVDVLGEPENIQSEAQLDVKKYGVIVTRGQRRGLLLPDLEGVDTVEDQVAIAKEKAGIPDGWDVNLQRFQVIRHT
jgi:AmmeMemoRadiSam system protein A/AmmeMemoRadiSam system protein B